MALKIVERGWSWGGALGRRVGRPPYIVLHHQAGEGTTAALHAYHRSVGYRGIGYHFHVRLDGTVHRGRPEWAIGAHTLGWNTAIGVCFEGNYETRREMPAEQLAAGRALLAYLRKAYAAPIRAHGQMSGNLTACPGRNFPLAELTKGGSSVTHALIPAARRCVLKQRMLWYAINNEVSLKGVTGLAIVDRHGKPSNSWGGPAKALAWRVSGRLDVKQTAQPTVALLRALRG